MNLTLMSQVIAADMAYIVLQRIDDYNLRYYLIASEVSHRVITTGVIGGTIQKDIMSFTIMLSSISLLTSKDYQLSLSYTDGKLIFTDNGDKFKLYPLCVESMDSKSMDSLSGFLDFYRLIESNKNVELSLKELREQLADVENNLCRIRELDLSLEKSNSSEEVMPNEGDIEKIRSLKDQIVAMEEVQKNNGIVEMDMTSCKPAAQAAARFHSIVEVYENNAVVHIGGGTSAGYMFVKNVKGTYCMPGLLLNKLLTSAARDDGTFYDYKQQLIYRVVCQDKKKKNSVIPGERSETFVFVTKYLPKAEVNTSLITRGTVEEKYTVSLDEVLSLAALTATTFPGFVIDLGEGLVHLTNDQAETIDIKLNVSDAHSVQLNRFMHGTSNGEDLAMASISLPKHVRALLNLFRGDLTIYVKHSKIIFNTGDIWLVFGRG